MECRLGSRPSFAWRSILHGRELIAKRMVMKLGDGKAMKIWTDNWIIDPLPRPLVYHPEADVVLSMCVEELIIPNTGLWDVQKVRRYFVDDDASLILKVKTVKYQQDLWWWGFTKDGAYSSQSGYRLLESIRHNEATTANSLPPIERKLWHDIVEPL